MGPFCYLNSVQFTHVICNMVQGLCDESLARYTSPYYGIIFRLNIFYLLKTKMVWTQVFRTCLALSNIKQIQYVQYTCTIVWVQREFVINLNFHKFCEGFNQFRRKCQDIRTDRQSNSYISWAGLPVKYY